MNNIEKENEFFSSKYILSYSGLNKLLFNPSLFYRHYILKQREDTTDKSAVEGKLIHCLLLEPLSFDNVFKITMNSLPGDNAKTVIDRLYNHYKELKRNDDTTSSDINDYKNAILDILTDMGLHQSLKTDESRVDKILNTKNIEYWDHLNLSENKILIDENTYTFANNIVEKIKSIDYIKTIRGENEPGCDVLNEILLESSDFEYEFGIRGIIDNLVFDHLNKEIRINDLKTTSKSLSNFSDSIEFYKYWLQASIYKMLVEKTYRSTFELRDYNISFRFIVVDAYGQIGTIQVSESTLKSWEEKTLNILDNVNLHHFINRNFSLPYDFLKFKNQELII